MTSFFAALEFLTVVRLRRTASATMPEIARAQPWFPVVGLLLGAALLAIDRATTRALPESSVDVLLVVALAALSGALHLDGLADAADGLLGGATPERRLAIMRDVHRGSFAIVAIVSVLALKWAGLAALPGSVRFEAVLLVPCLARFALLVAVAAFPYARTEGLGAAFRARHPGALLIGGAIAAVASVALLGAGSAIVLAMTAACALAFGAWVTKLAGGMTGDTWGATIEIAEAVTLLFIAALANRSWLDPWLLA